MMPKGDLQRKVDRLLLNLRCKNNRILIIPLSKHWRINRALTAVTHELILFHVKNNNLEKLTIIKMSEQRCHQSPY